MRVGGFEIARAQGQDGVSHRPLDAMPVARAGGRASASGAPAADAGHRELSRGLLLKTETDWHFGPMRYRRLASPRGNETPAPDGTDRRVVEDRRSRARSQCHLLRQAGSGDADPHEHRALEPHPAGGGRVSRLGVLEISGPVMRWLDTVCCAVRARSRRLPGRRSQRGDRGGRRSARGAWIRAGRGQSAFARRRSSRRGQPRRRSCRRLRPR